ncbi:MULTISPECIES: MauE/DoxX family redox-associated membrane protein [Halomonadaceae]|uniref:Methylamine utilization protein MauE n=2 Tax=Vreelandella TaxID=3137766 RepID=A0A7Z0LQZ8_9GAMM|nr:MULTISPECIES: MauE/DoxX family redox-associated membrane protein [Halomonas]AJY51493.1 glutaredoxin [Halomonas sp. KO116]NYS77030.1 glutaredoxin [Halomonas glaciei]|tara:strand:- start:5 stop:742 length:738 start_codon:yes stop_codon:yes gene_type:complete
METAHVYRMKTAEHRCPFGMKTVDLLKRKGYEVDDHPLTSRDEIEAFKAQENVDTTPQTYIGDKRIGGYEEVRKHLGMSVPNAKETTYRPVIAIFVTALLIGLAVSWVANGTLLAARMPEYAVATAMVLLGLQKLQDVESFSSMFLNYDLLAQRYVPYSYVYPYAETLAGVLMLAGALIWLAAPLALFIGTVGAVSVVKAVYIDKRELKCACVGGSSNVPLGFISLTENIAMILMGLWMPLKMWF